MARPRRTWSLPTTAMLFSAWQATTQALQPVQAFRSMAMPQAWPSYFHSGIDRQAAGRLFGALVHRFRVPCSIRQCRPCGSMWRRGVEHVVVLGGGEIVGSRDLACASRPTSCHSALAVRRP